MLILQILPLEEEEEEGRGVFLGHLRLHDVRARIHALSQLSRGTACEVFK